MKAVVWVVAAVLAVLWTGFAALGAAVLSWMAEVIASGGASDWARIAASWPAPAWLALWIDPAAVQAVQQTLQWLIGWAGQSLPLVASLVGWLVPLAWWVWGAGMLALLTLAGLGHWWIGRKGDRPMPWARKVA